MGDATNPLLSVRGVSVRFGGVVALDDVSFDVQQGQIAGLIGPNGAGKTTLFNIVAGALAPSEGAVRFRGRRIDGLSADRVYAAGVARTFQIPRPFRSMSVAENLRLGRPEATDDDLFQAIEIDGAPVKTAETAAK